MVGLAGCGVVPGAGGDPGPAAPAAELATAQVPSTDAPATGEPAAGEPAAGEPAAEEPTEEAEQATPTAAEKARSSLSWGGTGGQGI